MRRFQAFVMTLSCLCLFSELSRAQVRLLGLTGNQEETDQESFPDASLFEINPDTAESTLLQNLTHIPDGHVIGYNTMDGLLYHAGGSESWTDDPGREGGYRDHQYLETVDPVTYELTPIFNANPPESPDEFPAFGLAAPLPNFILPQKVRLFDDPECEDDFVNAPGICARERGEDEYHSLRGLAWSESENLFYGSDEHGIFQLTPDGNSTFVGRPIEEPGDTKAIAWYDDGNGTKSLLTGTKRTANLWTIDPENGEQIGDPVELLVPDGSEFDDLFEGLLGMAQHPDSGVLYGIRRIAESAFDRELIIIDPASGETTFVGNLGLHFTSLVFIPGGLLGDFNSDGNIDVTDVNLLGGESANGANNVDFDLNSDGVVDSNDVKAWIKDIANSWVGDSNVDGVFDSGDLVDVFGAGKFELDLTANWAEGDWNGDGRFSSGDLVFAFQDGGFEVGPRAAQVVPEPSAVFLTLLGFVTLWIAKRRRS